MLFYYWWGLGAPLCEETILEEVGMMGGRFEALFELDRSLLYTLEMEEVDALTWFLAACRLNLLLWKYGLLL